MALVNPFTGGQILTVDLSWIIAHITEPIGALFLRMLLMIVVPLVFSVSGGGSGRDWATFASWGESDSSRLPIAWSYLQFQL
jgi:hypothetical protein